MVYQSVSIKFYKIYYYKLILTIYYSRVLMNSQNVDPMATWFFYIAG